MRIYADGPGRLLRYVELPGSKGTVVFLTGMGLSAVATFLHVLPDSWGRGRRMVFVDPFGSGYSDAPHDFGYGLSEQASVIAGLLRAAGVSECVVVGFSAGGSIAVCLADEHPGLVARLVLVDANLEQGGGSMSPWIAGHSESEFAANGHDALVRRFDPSGGAGAGPAALHAFFARAAPHAVYRTARALVDPVERDIRTRLTELSMPSVCVRGETPDSELFGEDDKLRAAGIDVLVVPDAGHLLPWENPEGLAEALRIAVP